MSDENLNKNEETSALFVSSQKKKQAEEEARKKAEEEQARREAAEAEVRRMEQEVEARKKEVEEKKKAAEEAAATAVNRTKAPETNNSKTGGKSNIIKYIAIGAAALVVLFIIIGIAGSGKPKIDFDSLVFDKEYISSKEGYDVVLTYPGSLYSEVTEEEGDGMLNITFHSEQKGVPAMYATLSKTDTSLALLQYNPGGAADLVNSFFGQYREDGVLSEDKLCDLSDENTTKYEYHGCGNNDEGDFAVAGWIELGRSDKALLLAVRTVGKADDSDTEKKLLDAFYNENSSDAIKTPGGYPLDDINYDGQIAFADLGVTLPVPKDRFVPLNESQTIWGDENGAIIALDCNANIDPEALVTDEGYIYELKDYFLEQSKAGLTDFDRMEQIQSDERSFIKESDGYISCDIFSEFSDTRHGMKYWERDYLSMIMYEDVCGNLCIVTIVPDKGKGTYEGMFDEAIKKMGLM